MNRQTFIIGAMVLCLSLVGCGPHNAQNSGAGADVSQVLPQSAAGPLERINMPRRMQASPPMTATNQAGRINFQGGPGWKGHNVTLYFVPASTIDGRPNQSPVDASVSAQRITSTPIIPGGTWKATWNAGNVALREPLYILARTDDGQIGITEVRRIVG
jgi:hypothetical protein